MEVVSVAFASAYGNAMGRRRQAANGLQLVAVVKIKHVR